MKEIKENKTFERPEHTQTESLGNTANVLQGEGRARSLPKSGVQTLVSVWSLTSWVFSIACLVLHLVGI